MPKVLIVEDEAAVRDQTAKLLAKNGYQALILTDFATAEAEILHLQPDLILLDLNIPYLDGRQLLKNLRQTTEIPVIMVTSSNSEINEALTISYGADDYITKPYNPDILLLRIGAVLKRTNSQAQASPILHFRGIIFDSNKGMLEKDDKTITLTKTEMIILGELLRHQNQIVSREKLMTSLWHNTNYLNDNTLTVNISRLREKLAKLGAADAICTRKGLGYILRWNLANFYKTKFLQFLFVLSASCWFYYSDLPFTSR